MPQLFIAVVLMNFSRTICGLLIDISQVIMFTFVNALLDIAAGNFIQLFQLQDFGALNPYAIQAQIDSGNGITPVIQFTEAFLQIPLYGSIVAILFLLALAFLYRIVLLWVLVIMSPLAFFLGGIKGIFHGAEHSAGNWWGKFTGALMMGPILTFFLWLSLAAASGGSLAAGEGFDAAPAEGDTLFSVAALDSSHLTSLLLALILLTVGMQVAGEQSQKVGGMAQSLINDGMGRKVVGGSVALPFRAGRAAGGYATGKASPYVAEGLSRANLALGSRFGAKSLTEGVGQSIAGVGAAVGAVGLPGAGLIGAKLAGIGGGLENKGHHGRDERQLAADKEFKAKGHAQKMVETDLMEAKKGMYSPEAHAAMAKAYMDPDFRTDRVKHLMSQGDTETEANKKVNNKLGETLLAQYADKDKLPEADQNKLYGEMSKNLDKVQNYTDEKGNNLGAPIASKFIDTKDFDPSKLKNKTKIFEDPALRAQLEGKIMRTTKDGKNISVMDMARSGELGQDVRTAATDVSHFSAEGLQKPETVKGVVALMQSPVQKDERGNVKKIDMSRMGEKAVPEGANGIQADTIKRAATEEYFKVAKKQEKEVITSALNNGAMTTELMAAADVSVGSSTTRNAEGIKMTQALFESDVDLPKALPQKTKDQVIEDLYEGRSTSVVSIPAIARAESQFMASGITPDKIYKDIKVDNAAVNAGTVSVPDAVEGRVSQVIKESPDNILHFADAASANTPNDITRIIVRTSTPAAIDKFEEKIRNALGQERENSRQALAAMQKAHETELAAQQARVVGATKDAKKKEQGKADAIDEKLRKIREVERYTR